MVYYYLIYGKGKRSPSIMRKASTLYEIRKKAYSDLVSGKYEDEFYIHHYIGGDIALDRKHSETYNPSTKRIVNGKYLGDAYVDHADPLWVTAGKKYVYDLLPNGKLGGIDRELTL